MSPVDILSSFAQRGLRHLEELAKPRRPFLALLFGSDYSEPTIAVFVPDGRSTLA
jgi:hypothetical protein